MHTLEYDPPVSLDDLLPETETLDPLALQAPELPSRVIIVQHSLLGMSHAQHLWVKWHHLQESVSPRAHPRLLVSAVGCLLALESAAETPVFSELRTPARLASNFFAAGVLDGLTSLQVESLQAKVTCDVLQLLHPITRQSCGTRRIKHFLVIPCLLRKRGEGSQFHSFCI